jgi:hypothetical protein
MNAFRRVAFVAVAFWLIVCRPPSALAQGSRQISEYDAISEMGREHPDAREAWFMRGRSAPKSESAAALRYRALQQKLQMRRQPAALIGATPNPSGSISWTSLGPAPMVSAAYSGSPQDYNLVSGRATAVAIDTADASGNTVFVGGAHGGVWKSTNAANLTASTVTWTPVADFAATLAVGSIAIQPGNSNPNASVVLVGTGEPNNSADSYYGLGILRSADGGSTWTLVSSDQSGRSFAGLGFSKIAFSTANPQLVVAAAATAYTGTLEGLSNQNNRGIYYSTNGGLTWNYASILDGSTPISVASVTSVVYHPAVGKFFAAIRFHGVYSSSDGSNWTRLADTNQPGSNLSSSECPPSGAATCLLYRAELAVPVVIAGTQARNELYTWVVDYDTISSPPTLSDGGIWINTTGGATPWKPIADGGITACGDAGGGCGVEQGTYDLELLALANGAGTDLYPGAINLYKCTISNPAANSPGCSASFLNLTHVYGCSSIAKVHPDQHHLAAVIASGKALMYFANDGGLYRALDGYTGLQSGTCGGANQFDSLNGTLGSMTQFVSISTHPTDSTVMLGGTQDNGSPMTRSGFPALRWQNVHAGDGGYNAISPAATNDWFASYPDTGQQTLEIDHCPQGTACDARQFGQVVSSSQLGGDDGAFYFPYILDPQAPQELIVGTCRLWRVDHAIAPTAFNALSDDLEPGAFAPCTGNEVNTVRALAAGGPRDSNGFSKVVYAGTDGYGPDIGSSPTGGRVFVTLDASVPSPVFTEVTQGINPSAFPIADIAIDTSDATGQTAYAAVMGFHVGHVFKTNNAGAAWTDFTGPLPDAPVNSLFVDSQAAVVYAGTDVGVFATPTAAANWTEVGPLAQATNSGYLPNVPVSALRLFSANGQKLLRAATYGRGVWQYALVTGPDYAIGIDNTPLTIFGTQSSSFAGALTAFNGYSSSAALTCTAGSTAPPSACAIPGSPITPSAGGTGFAVNVGGSIGDYSFNVHGVGGDSFHIAHDATVVLHVVDFAIGAPSPSSVSVAQGNSTSATFNVSASGSFNGTVNLGCGGLPTGVTCSFSPTSAQPVASTPVTVTVTISASSTTATGTSSVSILANTSGAPAAKSQTLALTVSSPSFTVGNTTSSPPVKAGQPATYTFAIAPQPGLPFPSGGVQFACAPADLLAAVAQCSFSPPQIQAGTTGVQTITLTISTAGPAPQANDRAFARPWLAVQAILCVPLGLLLCGFPRQRPKRMWLRAAAFGIVLGSVLLILISCGGGGAGGSSGSAVAVSVSPATASVYPTQTQQFIAQVSGSTNSAVNWSATAGTIDAKGLYTPPATVASNTQATVTATSQADSSKSGQAAVTIRAITVGISPVSTSLYPSQSQRFVATVTGSTDTAVTWNVLSGGGTIDAGGLYTAPASMTSNIQATVQATAQADSTKSQTALVKLNAQTPNGSYTIHVNATSGSVTQTTTAVLIVQ